METDIQKKTLGKIEKLVNDPPAVMHRKTGTPLGYSICLTVDRDMLLWMIREMKVLIEEVEHGQKRRTAQQRRLEANAARDAQTGLD